MLHEPAAMPDYVPQHEQHVQSALDEQASQRMALRSLVGKYMEIREELPWTEEDLPTEDMAILARERDSKLIVTFAGQLLVHSEQTYEELDAALQADDLYPLLRMNRKDNGDQRHLIHIVSHRPPTPRPLPWWPNLLLFLATIVSVLFTGTLIAVGEIGLSDPEQAQAIGSSMSSLAMNLWRGAPYAIAILLILVAHEMGHYLMMRRHNAQATLPYFIPAFFINPFGTFGAAILLRESLKNRKVLLDVGASGPIAGFLLAVPIVIIGLATSTETTIEPGAIVEGNSLIYAFSKIMVFGEMLPSDGNDVLINQLAQAGWTGLFVTALNMIPLGQLDGGHVLYSLFGDQARKLFWPILGALMALSFFLSPAWFILGVILLLLGRFYAVPLDNITPLDPARTWVAGAALFIFIVSFTPVPLSTYGEPSGIFAGMRALDWSTALVVGLLVLPRWFPLRKRS